MIIDSVVSLLFDIYGVDFICLGMCQEGAEVEGFLIHNGSKLVGEVSGLIL